MKVVQEQKLIGLLDNEGNYFNTNISVIKRLTERYDGKEITLNPTLYFLSFKVKLVVAGYDFVMFLTDIGKVYS